MRSMTHYGRALIDGLREDGLLVLLWRILVKLASPLGSIGIDILYERDLTTEIQPVRARVDATLRHATEADIDAIIALRGPYTRDGAPAIPDDDEVAELREVYRGRLRRGETCLLAFVGSEIVAWDWMCRKWGEAVPFHPVVLLPDEFYGAEAFTAPAWRQRDLHKLLNNAMLRYAQSSGCRRGLTMANLEVWRSQRNLRRLGWLVSGIVFWFEPRRGKKVLLIKLWGEIDVLFRTPHDFRHHRLFGTDRNLEFSRRRGNRQHLRFAYNLTSRRRVFWRRVPGPPL